MINESLLYDIVCRGSLVLELQEWLSLETSQSAVYQFILTLFHTNKSADYDEFHCLKGLNSLSIYHNDLLKKAIGELKKENPNVVIVYGDYYNAFLSVYQNAPHLGESLSSSNKLLEQYVTGYNRDSVMQF